MWKESILASLSKNQPPQGIMSTQLQKFANVSRNRLLPRAGLGSGRDREGERFPLE
jgi:hypothetical protein